jgi:hypothetical protein
MSVQITTAFVDQFRDNVYHLTQQKGSKLRGSVRVETVNGKKGFYEQLGATSARKRSSRHADTPRMDTPHARRSVTLADYDWADLVDGEDQVRMLINPASQYAEAGAMAMGRAMDEAIVEAADGTAYTGQDGTTSTAYDTNMTVAVTERWPGVQSADFGLNVAKILAAAEKLGSNEVDPDEEKYMVVNARQIKSLLQDTKISSADFNAVKPLVEGQVAKFGGFNMIPCNRITTDANGDDKVLYWAKGGILLGVGKDIQSRISERDDKNYATQAFVCMSIGATRMEEARVGYIICDPATGPGA